MRKISEPEVVMMADGDERPSDPASGYSGTLEHSTPFHAFLEQSTTLLFPLLFIPNVYFAINRLWELELIWLVALALPLSLLWSDFVSGLVHWTADTYFSEDTPLIGASLIRPFRLHHVYPRDICTHNMTTTVGNVCIPAVPILSACLYLMWTWPDSGWLMFAILCIVLMIGGAAATNQFHKWAHQESPSTLVRWLQRTGLVLSPSHHQEHHTGRFDSHYCITNGWLNPLLNKIRFFRALETTLRIIRVERTNRAEIESGEYDHPGRRKTRALSPVSIVRTP